MTPSGNRFDVAMLYHPIIHVPDLEEAEHFYARVFGRPSTNISTVMATPPAVGHSTDYSTFTLVGDVVLDNLAPSRYFTGGVQKYADVETGHLITTGWYINGLSHAYRALRSSGFRLVNARDEVLELAEWGGGPSPFYSLAQDAGLRYQFFETFPFPLDPRVDGSWGGPTVLENDPLGIVRSSHHTILSTHPEVALKLMVDTLGGRVISVGRDEARGVSGIFVCLADAVFHIGTPDAGTAAAADHAGDAPFDTYHAITWEVTDLDQVARHLETEGVGIAARSEASIVTDPVTSLGVPWGFTTETITEVGQ